MERIDALTSLVVWSHRIGRVIAHEAGSSTPAAQWRVLSVLDEEGPLRVGALASACRVTQPGMTRLISQMAEHGLVDRAPDPADERAVVIDITAEGRRAREDWLRTFRETIAPRFADLTAQEWAAIETTAAVLATHTPGITTGAPR
jgi:DNA-binding MarR family transcriptional regulator